MGLLTFSINVTLDGCVDHQEGIADGDLRAGAQKLKDATAAGTTITASMIMAIPDSALRITPHVERSLRAIIKEDRGIKQFTGHFPFMLILGNI